MENCNMDINNMKKYFINVHYEGDGRFEIVANDEDEAREKVKKMFDNLTDRELIDNIADIFINDIYETEI